MISVCPLLESWFKVGTTSRRLEDDSGMGRSSAMQGSVMTCFVVGEKAMLVLVRLFGGRVSVRIVEKMMLVEESSSVWLMDTEGLPWSVPSEAWSRAMGLSLLDRMYGVL